MGVRHNSLAIVAMLISGYVLGAWQPK